MDSKLKLLLMDSRCAPSYNLGDKLCLITDRMRAFIYNILMYINLTLTLTENKKKGNKSN